MPTIARTMQHSPDASVSSGCPELWAGLECTINRVGNDYRQQLDRDFTAEVEAAVGLGVKALRYPILWEMHNGGNDWSVPDRHLEMMRASGVRPIIGLIHHGSGPRHTSLIAPDFAIGLASHARAVAERYPWVTEWTPVNEPLTTARFSALYGLWYPHLRDEQQFWIALLNQIDAVRLAMREIRRFNPEARLVQTEDLGKTYSTPMLAEQAKFENARRWMTWDLLCGKVIPGHLLWPRLARHGLADRMEIIALDPCPPDVLGINHYLTSDRFLDERLDRYPESSHGSNGEQHYADVEALRVCEPPPGGVSRALNEAWQRYRLPVAITESHNSCSRDEQMRWTAEAWQTSKALCEKGVPVVAVTPWAITGSRDWRSLLTKDEGHYECGAFDRSGQTLRATAMVPMLRAFAKGRTFDHPALDGRGWWHRPERLKYPPVPVDQADSIIQPARRGQPPILIVGATGTLGRALAKACEFRNLAFVATRRSELDIDDIDSIVRALRHHRPWAVINASGWVRVDDAEDDADGCFRTNSAGAIRLAACCDDLHIRYVGISTDLIFDGELDRAYIEEDIANPLNVYGASKAHAEKEITNGLTVRTAAFFSPHDPYNFAYAVARTLRDGNIFTAPSAYSVSPTYVPDLVDAMLDLTLDDADGIWHLTNEEEISWADFAAKVADVCRLPLSLVVPIDRAPADWRAKRPRRSGLATSRGVRMPALDDALNRFAREMEAAD